MLQALLDYFSDFLANLVSALATPFLWMIKGMVFSLGWLIYMIYDGMLNCAESVIYWADVTGHGFDFLAEFAGLPEPLIYLLNQVGFPSGLLILGVSWVTRKLIDLLPSWLTRF